MGEDVMVMNLRRREAFWSRRAGCHAIDCHFDEDSSLYLLLEHSKKLSNWVDESLRRGIGVLPRIAGRWFSDPIVVIGDYTREMSTWIDSVEVFIDPGVTLAMLEVTLLRETSSCTDLCTIVRAIQLYYTPLYDVGGCVEWVPTRCGYRVCIAHRAYHSSPAHRWHLSDSAAETLTTLF